MGEVYRATVDDSGASVAVKMIHPHLQRESGFRARFEREAELGHWVDHENVVRTLGAEIVGGQDGETAVLVMEYVEGRTLRDLLLELGCVPESLLRELARQIVAGLRAIHEAGIIHRDLKPENVLITRDDRVRIMDLGLARPVHSTSSLTKEGQFAGSLLYAAPEQLRGAELEPSYDQYALGLILYELAAGHHPFPGETPAEIIGAHIHASPRRLADTQPDVSPFFSEVVATLMDKAPERRFSSTAELQEALDRGEDGTWWADRSREADRALRRLRIPVTRESGLFGRSRDLGMLRGAWEATRRGEGRTILVEGEAGVGKTRLLDALLTEVEREDVRTLYGSYPPEGTQNGLTKAVLDHFGAARLEERLVPYFDGSVTLARALAATLRHEVSVGDSAPLTGDALSAALIRLARGLAVEKPVLWFVEDLHNASPSTKRRVVAMARALEGLPILLVLTTRPGTLDEEFSELSRLAGFRRLNVGRLNADALQRLVEALFHDAAVAERVGPLIADKSDGVPFFVFELLRGLSESGQLRRRADGRYEEVSAIAQVETPSAVKDLVRLRLDELSTDQRHLVDVASVQGHAFDPDLQARVLQVPRVGILQTLAHLERRGGLVRSYGNLYQFDHHLVQEVVLGDLPLLLLQEYHTLLAEALAAREGVDLASGDGGQGDVAHALARHLLGGGEPEKAAPLLRAAVRHVSLHEGSESAGALMRRALDTAPGMSPHERIDLLLLLAGHLHATAQRGAERAAIEEASELAELVDDDRQHIRIDMARGVLLSRLEDHEEAVRSLEAAIERAESGGFDDVTALCRQHMGFFLTRLGRHQDALDQFAAGLVVARRSANRNRESALLGQLAGALWALGRAEEAEAAAEEALGIARAAGDRDVEAGVLARIGGVCMRAGRHEEALDAWLRFLDVVREGGHRDRVMLACGNLGRTYESMGRLEEARTYFERAIHACRELGNRRMESMYRGLLGGALRALGDFEGARASVEHSIRILKDVGDRRLEACGLNELGAMAIGQGDTGSAVSLLRTSIALFDRHPFPSGRTNALSLLGRALAQQGDLESGRAHLEEAVALARDTHEPAAEVTAAAALAALGAANATDVLASFRSHEAHLGTVVRLEALYDLYRATRNRELFEEAQALLEHLVRHAPADRRESMRASVRLYREISKA